jgi:hypothetical protein
LVFLEQRACPFTRGDKGWLFGRWIDSHWPPVELTIARIAALNAAGNLAHVLTTRARSCPSLP